jgi:NADH-quinone oxidoreductase subunit C
VAAAQPETEVDLQQAAMDLVKSTFPDEVLGEGEHAKQRWVEVRRGRTLEILQALRDSLQFEMLMDLTAVDWSGQDKPERFSVVYQLFSLTHNQYFRVKVWVPEDDPVVPSAFGLWRSADWSEREVWDMYGIRFDGHPGLKRILLPESYTGHPLRKDYPLTGRGERYDFPKHTR